MNDPAQKPVSVAERQTRAQAQELLGLLPTLERIAVRVTELCGERRIDEAAEPLFGAADHLQHAWHLLVEVQALCAEAEFEDTLG
jgi:hypothetical protein